MRVMAVYSMTLDLVLHEKIVLGQIMSLPAVVLASLLFETGAISVVLGMLSDLVVRLGED
jgi:hypothetical protein